MPIRSAAIAVLAAVLGVIVGSYTGFYIAHRTESLEDADELIVGSPDATHIPRGALLRGVVESVDAQSNTVVIRAKRRYPDGPPSELFQVKVPTLEGRITTPGTKIKIVVARNEGVLQEWQTESVRLFTPASTTETELGL